MEENVQEDFREVAVRAETFVAGIIVSNGLTSITAVSALES